MKGLLEDGNDVFQINSIFPIRDYFMDMEDHLLHSHPSRAIMDLRYTLGAARTFRRDFHL